MPTGVNKPKKIITKNKGLTTKSIKQPKRIHSLFKGNGSKSRTIETIKNANAKNKKIIEKKIEPYEMKYKKQSKNTKVNRKLKFRLGGNSMSEYFIFIHPTSLLFEYTKFCLKTNLKRVIKKLTLVCLRF